MNLSTHSNGVSRSNASVREGRNQGFQNSSSMLRTGMWGMRLSGCAEIMHSADSDAAQVEASRAQVSESLLLARMKKRQENSSA